MEEDVHVASCSTTLCSQRNYGTFK